MFREEFVELVDGYGVREAGNAPEALKFLKRPNVIDIVILDQKMPGVKGTELLREIKLKYPRLKVVMMTGHGSKDVIIDALKSDADDFLEKPVNPQKIKKIIEKLIDGRRCQDDIDAKGINGKISAIKRFIQRNNQKKFGLKEAADLVYLSPKYLSRLFKEKTGKGFTEFRLTAKIEAAKKMLKENNRNVGQLSYDLGYMNEESFIRQFKKITGYTPTKFRKKHCENSKKSLKYRKKRPVKA
jgi:YesN/AraC family two-component response regulator